jgi:hypothetical protein
LKVFLHHVSAPSIFQLQRGEFHENFNVMNASLKITQEKTVWNFGPFPFIFLTFAHGIKHLQQMAKGI